MVRSFPGHASVPVRPIAVLQESLAREKTHAEYIEQRIADHHADSDRQTVRTALINIAKTEQLIADYDREATELGGFVVRDGNGQALAPCTAVRLRPTHSANY